MKLLFICEASLSGGALRCAAWIQGILSQADAHEILIFSFFDARQEHALAVTPAVRYIPGAAHTDPASFAALIKAENPDAIVIFGTEKPYTLAAVRLCESAGVLHKTALFAQGMACACADHYAEGVPPHIIRRWTLRDVLRRSNIRAEQRHMQQLAADEKAAVQAVRHFIGRTTLDRAVQRLYQPAAAYYRCNDILRSVFYDGQWSYDRCEPQRIFVSQYYYPLKGFHYLLRAASLLLSKYPKLTLVAAGYNPIVRSPAQRELKDSSYIRYLKSLVVRYGLERHIELPGEVDERQMKAEYLRANVFVLPSTIENSPNSLGEAMLLGVPTVAADVGGVSDFAAHRREAYLYPSSSVQLLAYYLDALLSNPRRAAAMGEAAKKRAERDYDRASNAAALEKTLEAIAKKR